MVKNKKRKEKNNSVAEQHYFYTAAAMNPGKILNAVPAAPAPATAPLYSKQFL
jgi:hypothetical protein